MDIGMLLVINLISIPLIYEAEVLGVKLGKFPSAVSVLRLKNALETRWIKLYGIFLFIFILISLVPSRSGKSYSAGYGLIASLILIQVVLWLFVLYKIQNSRK